MNETINISPAVIRRLPRYRRYLMDLKKKGTERISSSKLSEILDYTASQIRQDLNNFGGFGQQGYGYNVAGLLEEIDMILGLGKKYGIAIAGVGNLGHAVANYLSTYHREFVVKALFDVSEQIVGTQVHGVKVRHADELPKYLKTAKVDIGVITVSSEAAQEVADQFTGGGVKGLWNFAPVDLIVPADVALGNEHLSDSLHELVYYLNKEE